MKKISLLLTIVCVVWGNILYAQSLAPDQNPNYALSQAKYMQKKDSLLANQQITVQQTYKAYDYLEAKQEARNQRKTFRRDLRMQRAQHRYNPYYGNNYGYNSWPGYYQGAGVNYYSNGFHPWWNTGYSFRIR